jgi:hypothetical protein
MSLVTAGPLSPGTLEGLMRRLAIPLLLLLTTLSLGATLPPPASTLGFQGGWFAKDPKDGSCLYLRIDQERRSGGRVFSLQGTDTEATEWCEGESRMRGLAVLELDNHLATTVVWWCIPDQADIRKFEPNSLDYDTANDTITDSSGAVFHRQRLLIR